MFDEVKRRGGRLSEKEVVLGVSADTHTHTYVPTWPRTGVEFVAAAIAAAWTACSSARGGGAGLVVCSSLWCVAWARRS